MRLTYLVGFLVGAGADGSLLYRSIPLNNIRTISYARIIMAEKYSVTSKPAKNSIPFSDNSSFGATTAVTVMHNGRKCMIVDLSKLHIRPIFLAKWIIQFGSFFLFCIARFRF